MASITADNTLRAYLLQAKEVTEIRDAGGQVLGYFAPAALAELVPALRLAALFDAEELKRRKASTHPGYTFDEVNEHLAIVGDSSGRLSGTYLASGSD
jgi:hypothetical protein